MKTDTKETLKVIGFKGIINKIFINIKTDDAFINTKAGDLFIVIADALIVTVAFKVHCFTGNTNQIDFNEKMVMLLFVQKKIIIYLYYKKVQQKLHKLPVLMGILAEFLLIDLL